MKKLIVLLAVVLFVASPVLAQGLTYFPNETSGITLYDWSDHSLKIGVRYPALNWEELLYFDGALITDFDDVSIAGGLSVELVTLGRMLGLNVTLTDNVIFGWLTGYNFRKGECIYGIYSGVKWSW